MQGSTTEKTSIIQERLHDIVNGYESSLSRALAPPPKSSARRQGVHERQNKNEQRGRNDISRTVEIDRNDERSIETSFSMFITEAANLRSHTSQPPLQYNDTHSIVTDINLNPSERTAPQDLLENCHVHVNNDTYSRDFNTGGEICYHGQRLCPQHDLHNMTIKTITVLSVLTEETDELHRIAFSRYLPQLSLFGHDLSSRSSSGGSVNANADNLDELDEEIMHQRDSELLKRIGKFIVVLQTVYNLVYRCQKLVKNLVYQLYGSRSRLYMYQEDEYYELENGDNDDRSDPISSALDIDGVSRLGMEIDAEIRMNPEPALFGSVHNVIPVGQAISRLLEILISIDTVVANNTELLEAWDLYKSVVMEREQCNLKGNASHPEDIELDTNVDESKPLEVVNIGGTSSPSGKGTDDAAKTKECDEKALEEGPCKKQLLKLERMLMQLDFTLLSSRSFLLVIEQNFDAENDINDADSVDHNLNEKEESDIISLHQEIRDLVLLLSKKYCAVIDTEKERNERTEMVGVYGLYCLYRRLLPPSIAPDEKLHHMLCTILPRTTPILPLHGELPFFPVEFLSRYAPLDGVKSLSTKLTDIQAAARKQLSKADSTFVLKVSELYKETLIWMISAESKLAPSEDMSEFDDGDDLNMKDSFESPITAVEEIVTFLLKGIYLGRRAVTMLRNYLLMHKNLMEPVPSGHLEAIEKLCGIAKSIESTLRGRKRSCVILMHRAGLNLIASKLFEILAHLRSFVDHHHNSQQAQMSRIEASLSVLESLLKGSSSTFSSTRLHTIRAAIYSCYEEQKEGPVVINLVELERIYEELDTFSNIDDMIIDGCHCSFLFFHPALCAPLLRHIYRSTKHSDTARMQSIFSAFSDASQSILRASTYLDKLYPIPLQLDQFRKFFLGEVVHNEVLSPVVADIENTLRHRVHAKNIVEMSPLNPHNHTMGDFTKFINLPPLYCCGAVLDIKATIEKMLAESLYNSSTVGLRDTNSHTEMAVLARSYGLSIVDSLLPAGTVDRGLDLVEINEQFEDLMSSYNYNMNQQVFIERTPMVGRRYLNIIGIDCISMSLSRHGLGIIASSVDNANKFISKSFKKFLSLMSNEVFISSISKEMRWFEDQKQKENLSYPYERALAFWQEISRVQTTTHPIPLFEECKILITQVGNALGFLRLLRSGKTYFVNQSRKYQAAVPRTNVHGKLKNDSSRKFPQFFETMHGVPGESNSVGSHIFPETFRTLKEILHTSQVGDYSGALYILYPALSLSWLDASIRGKTMLRKKIKTSEGFYSDDGFAFGCAFMLQVFGLTKKADGLNWSQSFRKQFARDKSDILEKVKATELSDTSAAVPFSKIQGYGETDIRDGDNEVTRLQVSAKQLELKRKEMELLQFSFHAAVIIFGDAVQ